MRIPTLHLGTALALLRRLTASHPENPGEKDGVVECRPGRSPKAESRSQLRSRHEMVGSNPTQPRQTNRHPGVVGLRQKDDWKRAREDDRGIVISLSGTFTLEG